jgi:hypothetical protein
LEVDFLHHFRFVLEGLLGLMGLVYGVYGVYGYEYIWIGVYGYMSI